jgi:hypothetical protein
MSEQCKHAQNSRNKLQNLGVAGLRLTDEGLRRQSQGLDLRKQDP